MFMYFEYLKVRLYKNVVYNLKIKFLTCFKEHINVILV
jgi:hypothetical protein